MKIFNGIVGLLTAKNTEKALVELLGREHADSVLHTHPTATATTLMSIVGAMAATVDIMNDDALLMALEDKYPPLVLPQQHPVHSLAQLASKQPLELVWSADVGMEDALTRWQEKGRLSLDELVMWAVLSLNENEYIRFSVRSIVYAAEFIFELTGNALDSSSRSIAQDLLDILGHDENTVFECDLFDDTFKVKLAVQRDNDGLACDGSKYTYLEVYSPITGEDIDEQ